MTELNITLAAVDDGDVIGEIHRLSHTVSYRDFLTEGTVNWPPLADYQMRWRDTVAQLPPGDVIYVAWQGGQAAAFLAIEPLTVRYDYLDAAIAHGLVPASTGVVGYLHVHPEYLGQGIGQALMVTGKDYMRAQGWTAAVLDTHAPNTRARRFYEANGWTVFGGRPHGRLPFDMVFYRCAL